MEIYLIRHTKVTIEKDICYGQLDVSVSETFHEELVEIKTKLPTNFDVVYSSTLSRASKLAKSLQLGNVIELDSLSELNFGDWEGKKWNEINQTELNFWMADFVNIKPPKGENLTELYIRVSFFFDSLRTQNHSKVLIVAHSGVIRCVWGYLLAIPLKNIFKIPVGFGEVLHLKLNKNPNYDSIIKKM